MKTKKISLPIIIVSVVAFMMIATGIASWIITISKDFSLVYSKEGEIVSGLDCSPVVYDGNGHLPLLKDDAGINFKDADVFSTYKFEFRKKGEFNWTTVVFDTAYVPSAVKDSAPIDAGDYEIRYTDSTNYSCIVNFTIKPATPTVNNIATLGTTIYGKLPSITQPTSTPATYVLFDGSTQNVAGSFTFSDEESTKFNSTVRNYSGEATTTSASTKLLFVPTSTNYISVEVDATFTAEAVAYCSTTYYCSIEKALEANTSSGTIFVIPGKNPGIYENCTVVSGVTLTIPYSGELFDELTSGNSGYARDKSGYKKSEVTIFENITLSVLGTLNVGGIRTGGGGNQMAGQTALSYTQINLLAGAVISCSGTINCYGYIIGTYETNNESKVSMTSTGTIKMPFVVQEHRGGSMFVDMAHLSLGGPNLKTSPFNRFHFNNVESLITFEFGSKMVGLADLYANSSHNTTSIAIIGPNNDSTTYMIEMQSNTYVEARYVHSTQIIDLDIYGGFSLNPLKIEINYIGTITLSTKDVYMPVSWYYTVRIHKFRNGDSATCDLTAQKLKMLPGAKLYIDQGVTVNASEISLFDSVPEDTTGCPKYPLVYPTGSIKGTTIPAASVTINGVMNISKIGGLVLTTVEGAKLNVSSDAYLTTQELVAAGPTYATKKEYLKLHLYRSTGISESASVVATGNYESKADSKGKCGWLVDPINLSYDINLGDGAIVYKENITIKNSSGAVIGYNLTSSDLPSSVISNPTRENYTFIGWSLDPTIDPDMWTSPVGETVYANTVFYAIWKPVEYGITYDVDNYYDGTTLNSNHGSLSLETTFENGYYQTYNVEGTYSIPTPVIAGFQFGGWYTDAECTNRIVNIIPGTFTGGAVTIYALWNPVGTKEYTVEFEIVLPDGQVVAGDTVGFETVTQSCFSKDGVDFNLQPYINILVNANNNTSNEIYYTNITNNGVMITDSVFKITDSNTTNAKLKLTINAHNKTKVIYNNDSTHFFIITNDIASSTLPTGTSYSFKAYQPTTVATGYRMVWFTSSTKDNATFFIGNETYSSGFSKSISNFDSDNNQLTLYGEEYYLIKTSDFDANKIYTGSAANLLFYNFDFNNFVTTVNPTVSGGNYIGTKDPVDNSSETSSFRGKSINKIIITNCFDSDTSTILGATGTATTSWTQATGIFSSTTKYFSTRRYCGLFDSISALQQVIFGDSTSINAIGAYAFSDCAISNVKFVGKTSASLTNGNDKTASTQTPPTNVSTINIVAKP